MGELADIAIRLDQIRCLRFNIEMHPTEALEWAEKFPYYNGIRKGDLPRLVKGINGIVPPMNFGGNNANNGRSHHHFEIGNESSLVIYLVFRHFYLPEGSDIQAIKSDVMALAKRCHADEIDAIENDKDETRIRMWWD